MAVLLLNPGARSGADLEDAQDALEEAGVGVSETHHVEPDRLRMLLREGRRNGLVIVGGGDGTISLAAQELAHTDTVLGILPMGTQNSFARSLGIPLDLDEAAQTIAAGAARRVDLGMIGKQVFTHSVTIGVSTEVAKQADPTFKRVAGQAAYLLTGSRVLADHEAFRCRLVLDGTEHRFETHQLVITNGGLLGPADLAPDARMDDHLLHVAAIGSDSRWEFVRGWAASVAGTELPEGSHRFTAMHLRLTTDPPQQVDVDGEPGPMTPVDLHVVPRALRVVV